MATLTYQTSVPLGTTLTMAAASAGGDKILPDPDGVIVFRNGDASSKTITVVVPGNTKYGIAQPDYTIAVAAGAIATIGPFAQDLADPTDGLVALTFSAVTSCTIGAVRF